MVNHYECLMGTAKCLADLGVRVFALQPGTKLPKQGCKWDVEATNNVQALPAMFPKGQNWGLAALMGPSSGVMDCEPDSPEAYALLEQMIQQAQIRTVAYRAARGNHYWFQWDPDLAAFGVSVVKANYLECRLGQQDSAVYSACPPSIHPLTQQYYSWLPGCAPWETRIAQIPGPLKHWFLANYSKTRTAVKKTTTVSAEDDGLLPEVGNRHEYLLRLSKILAADLRLPKNLVVDMMRPLADKLGTLHEKGRGELELQNLVAKLAVTPTPAAEFAEIDFADATSDVILARQAAELQEESAIFPEIPQNVFDSRIQAVSLHARAAQYPRNLFLLSTLAVASGLLGSSVQVRTTPDAPATGVQSYIFGVGPSGAGKSLTINQVTAPLRGSERVLTDATPEAFAHGMSKFPRGLLVVLTEGKDFLGMFGRYSQTLAGSSSNTGMWLRAWSGDSIVQFRKTGNTVVRSPFCSIVGAIQGVNLNQIPGIDLIDGLIQRMQLFPLGRIPEEPAQESQRAMTAWWSHWDQMARRLNTHKQAIQSVDAMALAAASGTDIDPSILTLSPEANAVWQGYAKHKRSTAYLAQWPDEHPWRSEVLRHAEVALRMSAVLWVLDLAIEEQVWASAVNPTRGFVNPTIPTPYVHRAIDLMEWLWSHKQRLLDSKVDQAYAKLCGAAGAQTQAVTDMLQTTASQRSRKLQTRGYPTFTFRHYSRFNNLGRGAAEYEITLFKSLGWIEEIPDTDPIAYRFRVQFEEQQGRD